ncbi:MAG: ABC transporter ATP-binding protein [Lachnospiraceae bacterium]|nr:ABC transporter ATP-binding protein [Lachnospiraceae bacterium]
MGYYFKTEKMAVGYQKNPLIENIEISLEKGEILTLIGPNGAGKSTILKSIARQLDLISGVVYLGGKDLAEMSGNELSRNMAVVLTEKLRTEMMTCEDVVATGRYPYTGTFGLLSQSDYEIVNETMDLVHVTAIKEQDFTKISDGQRQRVMLARAICQEPDIIILDEPTSYLDVKYKLEFLSILQEMRRKKGLTVIMSLHELELAERVSDKILCVNGDAVERFGRPEDIFEPGYISRLFSISTGSFDEENGTMELDRSSEPATVFVIAGGGSGKSVFRRLQRMGTSFAAGILFENDVDYPVARALAEAVITTPAFEPISENEIETAKRKIDDCEKVICCKEKFGSFEKANEELVQYAREQRKLIIGERLWQK